MNKQLLKPLGTDVLSSKKKKLRKPLGTDVLSSKKKKLRKPLVLMFYRLRKKTEKNLNPPPTPPPTTTLVRPRAETVELLLGYML